ncbi:MAG: hypothetical protein JWM77_3418, partial [Rhodospirillales bacterium]|nr:hypothetical protein [Rhodospirillales bacterium]
PEEAAGSVRSPSRRGLLASLAGAGAATWLCPHAAAARPVAAKLPRAVDVHHHFYPPSTLDAWAGTKAALAEAMLPAIRDWTPQRSIEQLDRAGIRTAILSTPARGFFKDLEPEQVGSFVRRGNEYATGLGRDHPGRFGLFASLPLPDIEGSLHEAAYALDVLRATGVSMMTSYGDRLLGDPSFAPLLQELNRRRAAVFVHPLSPACCGNLLPLAGTVTLEFPFDTARTIYSLLLSGALARWPDIRWIFSHAGGPIAILAGRLRRTGAPLIKNLDEIAPKGIDHELRRLFYDTANSAFAPTMQALLAYVPSSQVLFGSDYPFVDVSRNVEDLAALRLPDADRRAVLQGNAGRILSLG